MHTGQLKQLRAHLYQIEYIARSCLSDPEGTSNMHVGQKAHANTRDTQSGQFSVRQSKQKYMASSKWVSEQAHSVSI